MWKISAVQWMHLIRCRSKCAIQNRIFVHISSRTAILQFVWCISSKSISHQHWLNSLQLRTKTILLQCLHFKCVYAYMPLANKLNSIGTLYASFFSILSQSLPFIHVVWVSRWAFNLYCQRNNKNAIPNWTARCSNICISICSPFKLLTNSTMSLSHSGYSSRWNGILFLYAFCGCGHTSSCGSIGWFNILAILIILCKCTSTSTFTFIYL